MVKPVTETKIIPVTAKSGSYKWLQRAAAIFIGGMLTSYVLFNYDTIAHKGGQLASFFKGETGRYTPADKHLNVTPVLDDVVIDSTGQTAYLKIKGKSPVVIANTSQQPDSTSVAVHSPELRYHIIAGCFTKKSNAKKLAKELEKQGFEPKIITSYKNYYTVIIKSFATKAQAKSFLPQTKSLIAHSWVLEWNV